MLSADVSVQQDGQHVVGRVTGSGQMTAAFAGLVHRALVAPGRRVDLRASSRLEPDHRHRVVQDPMMLLVQDAAASEKYNRHKQTDSQSNNRTPF